VKALIRSVLGLVLVLGWWFATSGLGSEDRLISPIILPSPAEVFRSFPSLLNGRQQQRNQHGNNRDHDEQLN